MFCAECGKANPDNAKFCEYCGSRLVSNVPNNNLPKQTDSSFENGANQNIATEMKMPVISEPVFENASSVKTVSKLSILIVFEIIIVIAAIYAGKMIGDKYYNSEYLALQYFECLMNGHPDKAYEYCSKDNESDFISREMYCSVIGSDNKKILSYKISKIERDLNVEKYEVVYRLAGDDNKYQMTITMKKNPDKKIFFIFDDWKVSMTDFICKDYIINVPKGVAELGYSYLEYGYEYDDYRDINAYFYYGFDNDGKFEIKSIAFDY